MPPTFTTLARSAALSVVVAACGLSAAGGPAQSPASSGGRAPDAPTWFVDALRLDPVLSPIIAQASKYRFQVLVAVPGDNADGSHSLRRVGFRPDAEYFYPASAVKLCAAVAALERVGEQRSTAGPPSLDATASIRIMDEPSSVGATSASVLTSVADEIRRALVVSDNVAFNRLFDFVGHRTLNERMWGAGLSSVRVKHYLGGSSSDASTRPRIEWLTGLGEPTVFPGGPDAMAFGTEAPPRAEVGAFRIDDNGRRIAEPESFAEKNRASLHDLQQLLIMVMRPDAAASRANLLPPEREFLIDTLAMLPSGADSGNAQSVTDFDALHKPLLRPIAAVVPDHAIRLFSKGGRAYGFSTENAFVEDTTTGKSFFLAIAVYSNENETINDDLYEYERVAVPVLEAVGARVAALVFRNEWPT